MEKACHMTSNARFLVLTLVLALLPTISHAKGADGLVILKGTLQEANTNDEEVATLIVKG
jgi:hypothetical protein